jgi:fibronectin type 3 domain-containing protein
LKPAWFFILCLIATGNVGAWQMKQAPLMTRWAALVDTNNPLPEYPRPQLVRTNWLNLNGIWQFQAGATNDPVPTGQTLSGEILVPYPMESAISGVMQYQPFSWYRRTFTVPSTWSGKRIILHLDAVDWQATVYVNGQNVGVHKGGYDPISYDITPYLTGNGAQELIVQVYNPVDNGGQPRGKQTLYPGGIMYTSSTGIWQPAWLEPVDASGVSDLQIVPDVDNSRLRLTVNTYATSGVTVVATALTNGIAINSVTGSPQTELDIPVPAPNLWSPENPFLYDLQITVIHNGVTNDSVTSYFGMRKISISVVNGTPEMFLNNKPLFEMGPLDQGFWPDGIYTAPTDAALEYDLQQEKAFGFNMVRKHIKVECQRWYYWADKLGLLVWQDMPSCNSYTGSPQPVDAVQFITELTRMVQNHWNSPAIIMWDIFNESQGQESVGQTNTAYLVQLVKTLDPSRLVNQASGGSYYGVGDVLDNHSYPAPGDPTSTTQAPVDGEYGGIGFQIAGHLWNPALAGGNYIGASTTNDIATIYDSFIDDLVYYKSNDGLNAAVYTQITDVENECNGLMTYDRVLKPDLNLINASNQKAVLARIYLSSLLPASQNQGRTWTYATNTPASNWYATNFDDSAWSSGSAGFGTALTPGAVVRTTWSTSNIWLRQTFTVGSLTPMDRAKLAFYVFHDEGCEIYLNGVLAASASGYTTSYVMLPLNAAGQNALIANGTNIIAVHCHQTGGGQNIDVGISKVVLVMNSLVVPTDYIGYWALDETNGTTANDSSGNGNNGTVSGAAWSSAGKVNGCLNFNGINNYVQVGNAISNDFSIAFWVKTTQSGSSGQWWQGAGLVDGYVAAGVNDFGTSLSNGKLAFGTGNPDTTILSTTPINDGVWHQCVATRQQSSGALAVYVDGNLQATGAGGTNSLTAPAYLRFGSLQTGTGFFSGSLDDIKIYNRALGSNEVTALYGDSASRASAPTNLTATAGNDQVMLSWMAMPGISGYDLKRATQIGGPYTSIANLLNPGYTDNAVTNGTTYYYMVAAENSLGDGTNSVTVSATPSLAASLRTWFAADAITGLANGLAVSNWTDISGNSDNATQPTASQRPTYVANAINGLPAVHFNAGFSNALAFARPIQDDFTIFCVFRSTQGFGTGGLYYQGAGLVNGEVSGSTTDFGTCLFTNGQICAGTGNPDVAVNSTPGFNNGQPHVMTFKRTESSGEVDLYVDGSFIGSTTGNMSSLTAPNQLVLGAQQTMINFLTGDIAEVKIYNSALADSDRITQESTLIHKWGISAPPAPTGLTAATGNDQVQLNWNLSSTAIYYNLKRSTNSGGPYTVIASPYTNNFVDATVVNGTTYYYVVSDVTPLGESANSTEVSATPSAPVATTWFKADAINGLANGASVATWADASGNGYNATQSTASQQPTYAANAINGLPAVHFNTASNTCLAFNRPVQNDFTILCVFRSTQGIGTGTQFYQGAGLVNGEVPNTANDFGTSLNANGQILAGTGNPDRTAVSGSGYNDGLPHLFTFKRTRSTGAIALYVDGALSATATGGTQSLTAPSQLVLGAQQTMIDYLTGDIAEVKIFNTALSDLNRNVEESGLECKYGIAGGSTVLATPTGLTGTPGNHLVSLNRSGSSGAATYNLSSSTNLNGPFTPLVSGVTANSYVDTKAVSGQTNYYEVTAVNGCNVSTNSAPVGVFLPKPVLSLMNASTQSLKISWPAWANDWGLYFATNLTPPVIWFQATNAVGSNNGQFNVTVPINSETRFFRLSAP